MRRGQAFEVFRLLIAAVIAGVILMVLLSILGGLTPATQDPDGFVRQTVGSLAATGGIRTLTGVIFKPGSYVDLQAAAHAGVLDVDCVKGVSNAGWDCDNTNHICEYNAGTKTRGSITVRCDPPSSGKLGDCTGLSGCSMACCITFTKQ